MSRQSSLNKILALPFIVVLFIASCSTTKFVPADDYLLKAVKIESEQSDVKASTLMPYVQQRPNSKWFSLFKVPLSLYSMSGRDSTQWGTMFLRGLGEAPVIYDSVKAAASCDNMVMYLQSEGYLHAKASYTVKRKGRKVEVKYKAIPGISYTIDSVNVVIEDDSVHNTLQSLGALDMNLKRGMRFSIQTLDDERKRITNILTKEGYYKFNKDFIKFEVDSTVTPGMVDVTMYLHKYKASNNSPETNHRKYFINKVNFIPVNSKRMALRPNVLQNNTTIKEGNKFSAAEVQNTYNNFSRLNAVRFTNIHFDENEEDGLLDCGIKVSTRKPNTISFQPEGTNTEGDFGAAATLTYSNNNIFRGSELFSVQFRGAYEAIKGLDGYQNQNYIEYNVETRLAFPRIIAPFLSQNVRYDNSAKSELMFSYNMQNRPEFHRRVLTSAWRYYWKGLHGLSYRFDLIDINFVHMPWISSTFKSNYLDDTNYRNAILKYNYEDLFIVKSGVNISYSYKNQAFRTNIEVGGNVLNAISHLTKAKKNSDGQYTLFKIAYAQYVKGDFDYTRLLQLDVKNQLALHFGLGIAFPYGNSNILPFEKRYFSGGANSVRGWNVRELGPGKFRGSDGKIDFINQTGDMKLDMNVELRTALFWKFNGAFFIDAGNIWTLKNYKDQPGGQFKFDTFLKQLAVAYGLGLRVNFDYFIVRLDCGMKAINPAYTTSNGHYPIINPKLRRDLSVHFAVGMPF
ncbi:MULTISPECIES: translocation and assembly module lipoprotein TamL [Prevotellaceae]|uniref:translocation and assembly module lipoprotein TamL n=1 Tax=Leyella stercorea TaxID=363265 RepID=UPI001F1E9386|nr:BamA/TamA family outer membrane protein [Leyella stercorea]MCF2578339.1 BamA/TamA family outer membrane protein [Leyella stercorea]